MELSTPPKYLDWPTEIKLPDGVTEHLSNDKDHFGEPTIFIKASVTQLNTFQHPVCLDEKKGG